ncbi:hypothetical protein MKQ68_09630 [Chitinophaga horti]|uniref:Lipoprotein n=1 Tax=Chitinophaga horti TaxID=2920382 RepID=A0ABY6JAI9_9BACT|nr:hypothetical protein [Chitinophaga horti]UYQ95357.1 hypothetical protein MKQ68_09630 [Chitinophaga horti]
MKRLLFAPLAAIAVAFSACSKDNDKPRSECFADSFVLTETSRDIDENGKQVFLDFDVKNTSTKDYAIANGAAVVNLKLIVTTTDGATYETTAPVTITSLSAGATSSYKTLAKFGTDKTFQSVTFTKSCQ